MKKIIFPLSLLLIWMFASMCKPAPNAVSGQKHEMYDTTGSLKSVAGFPIGASVNVRLLYADSAYQKTLINEFNSITAENAMKWEAIHPEENKYDFTGGDKIVQFGAAHHMRIHGHNLCWYQANPAWLKAYTGTREDWKKLLKNHIHSVVERYRGKVGSWDVVNEAFDENGQFRKNDPWAEHIGPEYIEDAFRYAHEADPAALLFYNDYGQDESVAKTAAILQLVTSLQSRGVPIHGIGLQMHINLRSSNEKLEGVMKKFAATGLLIHISELDISINGEKGNEKILTSALSRQQADKYQFLVKAYQRVVSKKQQFGITLWDVGDKDSWIPRQFHHADWPLLFDSTYRKKGAYYAFLNGLK